MRAQRHTQKGQRQDQRAQRHTRKGQRQDQKVHYVRNEGQKAHSKEIGIGLESTLSERQGLESALRRKMEIRLESTLSKLRAKRHSQKGKRYGQKTINLSRIIFLSFSTRTQVQCIMMCVYLPEKYRSIFFMDYPFLKLDLY